MKMKNIKKRVREIAFGGCLTTLIAVAGVPPGYPRGLEGTVRIDGSSTVFPISEAVAEEFSAVHPRVRVTVGISGTGGGFKKFCPGETDISDASRPIQPKEIERCAEQGTEYIELPVAFDGIAIVVNPENDWAKNMTVEELRMMWRGKNPVKKWSEIRSGWPEKEIRLYGPGTDSGTFDYFTEVILGKKQPVNPDFTASEDDNVLVQGVAGDRYALGYFGFAYYQENKGRLNIVAIDGVTPSPKTINNGTYTPLSRPLFIYVNAKSADRPEVREFVNFYLTSAPKLISEVGYVSLPDAVYSLARKRFDQGVVGTVYSSKSATKKSLGELFGL